MPTPFAMWQVCWEVFEALRKPERLERMGVSEAVLAKIASRVRIVASGCWEWQGVMQKGYGRIIVKDYPVYIHRLAAHVVHGDIPDGMEVDHLCKNRSCCNPSHLEIVTARENTLRGDGAGMRCARKTHCPNGHPYDIFSKHGRSCRTCSNVRKLAGYHRRRGNVSRAEAVMRARQLPPAIGVPEFP